MNFKKGRTYIYGVGMAKRLRAGLKRKSATIKTFPAKSWNGEAPACRIETTPAAVSPTEPEPALEWRSACVQD